MPYAQRFLGLSPNGAAQQIFRQLVDAGRLLLLLPGTVERVLTKVEAGEIEIRIAEDGRNGLGHYRAVRVGRAARSVVGVVAGLLVAAAGFAAGVVLMLNQLATPAWFCLGLAALATLSLAFRR
jgi:hypothetical protein